MTAGLYIHIPFCEIRCSYCDFFSVTNRGSQIPTYLNALKTEIEIYSSDQMVKDLCFETLYFGGGTPSLLTPSQVSSLIDWAHSKFTFSSHPEITLETNPGTVNSQKLLGFSKAGVNRLSLGVQSFQKDELDFLDRNHTAEVAVACYCSAREAGFDNISVDLIFGLPQQRVQGWRENLASAVALQPNHISAYNLTFEEGTPLTSQLRKGNFKMSPEGILRELHLTAIEYLQQHGFVQYEISNYAIPGYESQHNQKYWNGSPYLGLGVSSHSFLNNRRFWNARNFKAYCESLLTGKLAVSGEERLGTEEASLEKVWLGLRQCGRGIHLQSFESEIGISLFEKYVKPLSKFFSCDFNNGDFIFELTNGSRGLQSRLLEIENGFLRLTRQGVLLCDAICAEFV